MILDTVADIDIREFHLPTLWLQWDAGMMIDCDGSGGNPDKDPYYQNDTAYHHKGKALDPYKVPFIVVPPTIIQGVKPVVLGCMGIAMNLETGEVTQVVVGDVGPKKKLGEASCECAKRVGVDPDPVTGGLEREIIRYQIWPGKPAIVDNVHYKLQPS